MTKAMNRRRIFFRLLLLSLTSLNLLSGQKMNLLPNGGAEDVFLNDIEQLEGYRSRIHPEGRGFLPYWTLTSGARVTDRVSHAGIRSVELEASEKEVRATIEADFWKVRDPHMPFGLPLLPGSDIEVSFFYRTTAPANGPKLRCEIRLGTIDGLPSERQEFLLNPSTEWTSFETRISLQEVRWGASISFFWPSGANAGQKAWVDSVRLVQAIEGLNLLWNPSFEDIQPGGDWPAFWQKPVEDQWVSWVGATYRAPTIDDHEGRTGKKAVRCSVTYGEGSGISQKVRLRQEFPRPVIIHVWSKLDNSIGNSPPGYWGPDNLANLTVYVFFKDGSMQEVSPTFSLGVSDHDWSFFRFGFRPLKPAEEILVQLTVLGSEPTTSLWMDDLEVFEPGMNTDSLRARGLDLPPRTLFSVWGGEERLLSQEGLAASNDERSLYLRLPRSLASQEVRIYLNPKIRSDFLNHERFLYHVIRVKEGERSQLGTVVEKQGYSAEGLFENAEAAGIQTKTRDFGYIIEIPFRSLNLDGPSFDPFGLEILWDNGSTQTRWNGRALNNREMGRIILARNPGLRIQSLSFGRRYFEEQDQSQDFVSHPQLFAGRNTAELALRNEGSENIDLEWIAGVSGNKPARGEVQVRAGERTTLSIPYEAGVDAMTEFVLEIVPKKGPKIVRRFPLVVPPAFEAVLDQEFYYPEEKEATVEIHSRMRPFEATYLLQVEVFDRLEKKRLMNFRREIKEPVAAVRVPVQNLRINPLPVQDYELRLRLHDSAGREWGKTSLLFGRIERTKRRPLPPITSLRVEEHGRLVINETFRFFPVVPSVNIMDWDEAIDLGANVFRSWFAKDDAHFRDTERAWSKNAYTITIGPGSPDPGDPDVLDRFKKEAPRLLSHPGFLGCYPKQFYYWKLSPDLIEYRKRVEDMVAELPSPRLVIWGHHDSSFLYDREGPNWNRASPPVGYCYVKIMGRPGSLWRNAPFLTKTERVLHRHRFLLAEVNYYVSFHADEVVPEQYPGYLSLRADDWRGVRAESYLAVIYGANGLYHWICTQKGQIQRLRGWFQELNFMGPILAADDSPATVHVSPADARVEVRLKEWQGKYYLLTANASEETREASITLPHLDLLAVKKLFDVPGDLKLSGRTLTDRWRKYDAHIYEIIAK